MTELISFEWMAPIMFAGLVMALLIGYPVAFSLTAVGFCFGFFSISMGFFDWALMSALPERVFGIMSNQLLLSIPFFTFMGAILERCGLAEDMLETAGQLFGPVRGGLAYAVIIVGAMLGAMTGTVAASVIAMGLISLPIMMRYKYNIRLATGVIAASGTIAQIIPPSLVLIVLADAMGVSVGDLYAGAFVPAGILVLMMMGFVFAMSVIWPATAPALPPEMRTLSGLQLVKRVIFALLPALILMFFALGTILLGIATPSEAGAMGGVGALILAIVKRRLTFDLLKQGMDTTLRITCMVIFILVGSTTFMLVFRGVDGDLWVEHLLTSLPGGQIGFLVFVNIMVFVIAFFLDFFEIAFIIMPLLAPVARTMGIDQIWFGVMIGMNMQTSFMHPPFGFALFYLRSVAPKAVRTEDIYIGAIPWVVIFLVATGLIIAFPGMVALSVRIFGAH
jgi:tripartite ATP-independent transporter DctM subunit